MKKKWGKREEILPWRAVRLVKLLEKSMVVEVFILEIVIWLSSTKNGSMEREKIGMMRRGCICF